MVTGPNPSRRIAEPIENKRVTNPKDGSSNRQSENLVSGLFSETEFDAELKLIIETWPKLSVEVKKMIVKIVK